MGAPAPGAPWSLRHRFMDWTSLLTSVFYKFCVELKSYSVWYGTHIGGEYSSLTSCWFHKGENVMRCIVIALSDCNTVIFFLLIVHLWFPARRHIWLSGRPGLDSWSYQCCVRSTVQWSHNCPLWGCCYIPQLWYVTLHLHITLHVHLYLIPS